MKKKIIYTAAILFSIVSLISCDKLKEKLLEAFTADGANFSFSVSPISSVDTMLSMGNQTIYFDMDSTIKAVTSNAFSLSSISKVTPNSITLKIQNPDTANNFANFQSGSISFSSNNNTTPYTFNFTNPDQYADSISIPVDTNTNLKTYMEGKTFNYTLMGKLRRATTSTLQINANVKFKVH